MYNNLYYMYYKDPTKAVHVMLLYGIAQLWSLGIDKLVIHLYKVYVYCMLIYYYRMQNNCFSVNDIFIYRHRRRHRRHHAPLRTLGYTLHQCG